MIHKMAFQNPYDPKSPGVSREPADVLAEIRSYFATGTCMQELHIDPTLMTDAFWDALAEAANWSRANADVLADTHWIGGDPAKGEVYGWASWAKRKGILSLAQPVGSARDNRDRHRRSFRIAQRCGAVVFAPQPLEARRRRCPDPTGGRPAPYFRVEAVRSPDA